MKRRYLATCERQGYINYQIRDIIGVEKNRDFKKLEEKSGWEKKEEGELRGKGGKKKKKREKGEKERKHFKIRKRL